jgi:hypothetical protein
MEALQLNPDYDVFWRSVATLWFKEETGLDLGYGVSGVVDESNASSILQLDPSPEHVAQMILARWLKYFVNRGVKESCAPFVERVARWYGGMALSSYSKDVHGWTRSKSWTKILTNEAHALLSGYSDSADPSEKEAWMDVCDLEPEVLESQIATVTDGKVKLRIVDVPTLDWDEWIKPSTSTFEISSAFALTVDPPPIGIHDPRSRDLHIPARIPIPKSKSSITICFRLGEGGICVFTKGAAHRKHWWTKPKASVVIEGALKAIASGRGEQDPQFIISSIFPFGTEEHAAKEEPEEPGDTVGEVGEVDERHDRHEADMSTTTSTTTSSPAKIVNLHLTTEFLTALVIAPSSSRRNELWRRLTELLEHSEVTEEHDEVRAALGLMSPDVSTYHGKDGLVNYERKGYDIKIRASPKILAECERLVRDINKCELRVLSTPFISVGVDLSNRNVGYTSRLATSSKSAMDMYAKINGRDKGSARQYLTRGQSAGDAETKLSQSDYDTLRQTTITFAYLHFPH